METLAKPSVGDMVKVTASGLDRLIGKIGKVVQVYETSLDVEFIAEENDIYNPGLPYTRSVIGWEIINVVPELPPIGSWVRVDVPHRFQYHQDKIGIFIGQHSNNEGQLVITLNVPSFSDYTPAKITPYSRMSQTVTATGWTVMEDYTPEITPSWEMLVRLGLSKVAIYDEAVAFSEVIGQRLIQESDDRGWCSEFDDIINEVNESLPSHLQLPLRQREYLVTWTEEVTISVSRSTVVNASDEDSAEEYAREVGDSAEEDDIVEAIRNGEWESDNSFENVEVELA
jgi:hypothetical protein